MHFTIFLRGWSQEISVTLQFPLTRGGRNRAIIFLFDRVVNAFLSGARIDPNRVWLLLAFELWRRQWLKP